MKKTDKGADKTQEAAGTSGHVHSCGGWQPCAPTSPAPALCHRPVARSGPSSGPCTASKDLAVLHRAAGDGLHP